MNVLTLGQEKIVEFLTLLAFPEKEKERLLSFLRKFSNRDDFFIVGGAVRDFFLGKRILDLDLCVKEGVEALALFAKEYLGYNLVPLAPELGIYRIAKGENSLDLTLFRGKTLEEDLRARDFTFNAMAIPVSSLFSESLKVVDPFDGCSHLIAGKIKIIGKVNVIEDPLRILRGYRFFAQGIGEIEEDTRRIFKLHRKELLSCAKERILQELSYIFLSEKCYETFKLMDEDGVLGELFPFFEKTKGVAQPSFHHLDVWGHLLESLKWAEKILKNPEDYLGLEKTEDFHKEEVVIPVKLASLFHDLGKAFTFGRNEERITFYGHEKVSAELFKESFENYRLKKDLLHKTYVLIKNHMRPFHLLNEKEKGTLTIRAKRHLLTDVPYWLELFVVAMADSYASQGPDKEPDYEERLKAFFFELKELKAEMESMSQKRSFITGQDLISLGLKPGPMFKEILQEIELLFLEKKIHNKEEALDLIKSRYLNL
ncbi:HD domain-containing protein [Thermodesulfobacterium hveragerdense]|uniref:HD domain-containing protein n=1 Tax=Thermodesulfobacterium hveragerdense TaxID=53424 RepID=UPI00040B3CAB|nr:HD domain-containing protein [Thermodesulfobacterium hveragerdense]